MWSMPPPLPLLSQHGPHAGHRKAQLSSAVVRVSLILLALAAISVLVSRYIMSLVDTAESSKLGADAEGPDFGPDRLVRIENTTRMKGEDILRRSFAERIIVSEKSRLIYCPIPKAASSNWKFLIRKFEGLDDYSELKKAHLPETSGLRYLTDYSPGEVERLLADPSFLKFAFVREPYSRAVSCYMDKFLNKAEYYVQSEYRNFLAELFDWRYARSLDVETAPRPSFVEFVDELAKQSPLAMNEHWRPQSLLCGFGEIPYDFIGRMENLRDDTAYVLSRLGRQDEEFPSQGDIGFPSSGASDGGADDFLTLETMIKLRIIYDVDFNSRLGSTLHS